MKLEHIGIEVKNVDTTVDWYKQVFDCKIFEPDDRSNDPVMLYFLPDTALAIFKNEEAKNGNMIGHFAIEVSKEDFDLYKKRIKDLSINMRETTHDFPVDVDTFYFKDCNGIEFEIFTKK